VAPVTDIDRAKAFYADQVGFVLDLDAQPVEGMRIVQLTPPGSACSILLSTGLPQLADMDGNTLVLQGDVLADRRRLLNRRGPTRCTKPPHERTCRDNRRLHGRVRVRAGPARRCTQRNDGLR
jgi:catechol 2,3-dioxygenase-like lactoylglutathione lyase family enzyme